MPRMYNVVLVAVVMCSLPLAACPLPPPSCCPCCSLFLHKQQQRQQQHLLAPGLSGSRRGSGSGRGSGRRRREKSRNIYTDIQRIRMYIRLEMFIKFLAFKL